MHTHSPNTQIPRFMASAGYNIMRCSQKERKVRREQRKSGRSGGDKSGQKKESKENVVKGY